MAHTPELDTTRLSRTSRHKLLSAAADEGGRDSLSLRRLVLIQNSMVRCYYQQPATEYGYSSTPPPSPSGIDTTHSTTSSTDFDNNSNNHDDVDVDMQPDAFVFPNLSLPVDPHSIEAEANWLESVLENLDSDIDYEYDYDIDLASTPTSSASASGTATPSTSFADDDSTTASDIDMSETWFMSPACPCSFDSCICPSESYPPLPDLDDDCEGDDGSDNEEYEGPATPMSTSGLEEEDVEKQGDHERPVVEHEEPTYFSPALRPHSHFHYHHQHHHHDWQFVF